MSQTEQVLPREADAEMAAAGAEIVRQCLDHLDRGGKLSEAEELVAKAVYQAMTAAFFARAARASESADKTEGELDELKAAGLTVEGPVQKAGEAVFTVSGPGGSFGYIPPSARRSKCAWWPQAEPGRYRGGVTALIQAAAGGGRRSRAKTAL